MAASLPAVPVDLDSTKDVDSASRNSPAAKQNKTVRGDFKEKAEGKQPRINVATTGDITHQSIELRGIIKVSTKSQSN
jgi:hypothetical protein